MPRFQFNIRALLWLTLVAAIVLGALTGIYRLRSVASPGHASAAISSDAYASTASKTSAAAATATVSHAIPIRGPIAQRSLDGQSPAFVVCGPASSRGARYGFSSIPLF